MSTSSQRTSRRNYRQNQRRAELTAAQLKDYPVACDQYVIFGDKEKRTLQTFIDQHNG